MQVTALQKDAQSNMCFLGPWARSHTLGCQNAYRLSKCLSKFYLRKQWQSENSSWSQNTAHKMLCWFDARSTSQHVPQRSC